jgi:hypothetical protein
MISEEIYVCWLCNKKCGNLAEYRMHIRAHGDALNDQKS